VCPGNGIIRINNEYFHPHNEPYCCESTSGLVRRYCRAGADNYMKGILKMFSAAVAAFLLACTAVMYWLLGSAPQLPQLYENIGQPEIVDGLLIDPAFDGNFISRQHYLDSLEIGLKGCDSIPVFDGEFFQSFNPDGPGSSAWNRSACFQRLAVKYQNSDVCRNVWRRYSIFAQSWKFSESTCRCKVKTALEKSTADIYKQVNDHRYEGMRLVEINTQNPGSTQRYEFQVQFVGNNPGRYRVQIYLFDEQGNAQQILLQDLDIPNKFGKYNLGVSRDAIIEKIPTFRPGVVIPVTVIKTLIISKFGSIDPARINAVWPASTRSQIFKAEVNF
jgi:hypothetical protein